MEKLKYAINKKYSVLWEEMVEKNHSHRITQARNMTYFVMHYYMNISANKIANVFERSSREVKYRLSNMKFLISTQKSYHNEYKDIISYMDL